MEITRVGFGAWAIGGPDWAVGWGAQDDQASIAAIRHAVARGINWINTAAIYGLGHSEIVRQALAEIPVGERPNVFTKCGLVWDENNRQAPPRQVGLPASIRREVDASLKRLGVERIDLYQMHWPAEDGTPLDAHWQTLLDLKKEAKARAVGLSNHNAVQLGAAEALGHVDTLQPPFSAIRHAVAEAELPWCHAQETGVIVYSPMQSGLLSGRFTVERAQALPKDDWRSRNSEYSAAIAATGAGSGPSHRLAERAAQSLIGTDSCTNQALCVRLDATRQPTGRPNLSPDRMAEMADAPSASPFPASEHHGKCPRSDPADRRRRRGNQDAPPTGNARCRRAAQQCRPPQPQLHGHSAHRA
jgi:aryl-alcohol dehydrogenase-like predicted oxidoreductase